MGLKDLCCTTNLAITLQFTLDWGEPERAPHLQYCCAKSSRYNIIGASLSELHTYRTAVQNPPDIYIIIYIYMYIFVSPCVCGSKAPLGLYIV